MMKSLPLYYHLLGLEASNNSLIRQYELLSHKREIKEDLLLEELKERLNLRKTFKKELKTCIKETFSTKNKRFIEGVFIEILPWVILANEKINGITYKTSWEKCNYGERINVKKYYDILYIPDLPKTVTDLLLEQKSQVEGYLLGNPL